MGLTSFISQMLSCDVGTECRPSSC